MSNLNGRKVRRSGDDFKKYLFIILGKWPLILAFLVVTFTIAYLVNRYSTKVYQVNGVLLIKKKGDDNAILDLLYDKHNLKNKKNISNEMIMLQSTSTVRQAIEELQWIVSYYNVGNIKTSEIYPPQAYITVKLPKDSTVSVPYSTLFKIKIIDNDHYVLSIHEDESDWSTKVKFGKEVPGYKFTIEKKAENIPEKQVYLFRFNHLESLAKSYQRKLSIRLKDDLSSILDISIKSYLPQKDVDFINKLMEVYLKKDLEEKNINTIKTIEFIDGQLTEITDSLQNLESKIELFKEKNLISNLSVKGEKILDQIENIESEKINYIVLKKYYEYLEEYLKDFDIQEEIVAPSSVGINEPLINSLIRDFVTLQSEIRIIINNEKWLNNPTYNEKSKKLNELRSNILENLKGLQKSNDLSITERDNRVTELENEIRSLPSQERHLINISRIYDLNEQLYIFLAQKKAEAEIARASNTADGQIIDQGSIGAAISPQTFKNYLSAAVAGILAPSVLILLSLYFNDKIRSVDDIEEITSLPLIGFIGHKSKGETINTQSSKSVVLESFRSIRSNIQYVSPDKKTKVILVTSSIGGEGKSFCALNLAHVFAITGKKTVLIGADLRKPNKYTELEVNNDSGLSAYLAGLKDLKDIVTKANNVENLSVVRAVSSPPNPVELLMNDRMEKLMSHLKESFDVIIIDTPPLGILSDSTVLAKFADTIVYIIRQKYTPKSALHFMSENQNDELLKNIYLVLNDLKKSKMGYTYGYGYGYGYGYYADDHNENAFKKIVKKLKFWG